jgi:hypothetical protein
MQSTKGNFMSKSQESLPKGQLELRDHAAQALGVLSPGGLGPEVFNLSDDDVAKLDALVSEHSALIAKGGQLRNALKANTKALTGRKGSYARLSKHLRRCANIARVSDASSGALIRLGIKRKKVRGSRRNAPQEAPEFTFSNMVSGAIEVRFREAGSASPRARAANTIGVHIAVVDADKPVTRGEADHVPTKSVSRSPARLDTTGWPAHVRLYACWVTQRGETSPWSLPLTATVR